MFPVRMTSRTAAAIAVALAAAAPAAYAVPARDTGGATQSVNSGSYPIQLHRSGYLVSPDAQDAAAKAALSNDRRSPDAVDAARGATPPTHVTRVVRTGSSDSGFDWGDAGIGALAMLGIAGLGAGTATGVARHRRRLQRPVTTG